MPGSLDPDDDAVGTRALTPLKRQSSYTKACAEPLEEPMTEELVKDKKKKEKPERVPIKELFRYASGGDKALIFFGVFAAMLHGGALPGVIIVLGKVLDEFIVQSNFTIEYANDTAGLQEANDRFETRISYWSMGFGGIAILTFILGYLQTASLYLAGTRQIHRIREAFFKSILYQEIGWFDTHNTGELVSRLSGDVIKIQQGLGEKNGLMMQWVSSAIVGLVVGFVLGPLLAVVILACSPALAISAGIMSKMVAGFQNQEQTAYAKAGSVAEEVLSSIRTVVAYGGEDKEAARYGTELEAARKLGIRKANALGIGTAFVFTTMFSTYGLAFWWGSQLILKGDISGGDMLITFFCVLIAGFSFGHAATNSEGLMTARGAAVAVYRIINRESEINASKTKGLRPSSISGDITFSSVGFSYPSRPDVQVLRKVDLEIPSGKTVAIVGASGCGKSTLTQLIQRFYDPQHGEVKLDGEDIRALNTSWLRNKIGVVSQEPVLFATTIRDNIAYGTDREVTQEEIEQAAEAANAHSFISDLPEGYNTLVGERGSQLSGGQKQRVAIARALVRDPRILLLDEATSALDTESEAIVQAALDKARQGRTTIIIAHRLSTVRNADLIVALDSGEVSERGTHDELMEIKGIYYTLVTMQTFLTEAGAEDQEVTLDSITGEALKVPYSSALRQISLKDEAAKFNRQISRQVSQGKEQQQWKKEKVKEEPSAAGDGEEKKVDPALQEPDDEFKDAKAPMKRLFKDSLPEWWALLLGLIGAMGSGVVMPLFAIIFSKMLEIFSYPPDRLESQANFYSGMFPLLGIGSGILMWMNLFFFSYAGEGLTKRMRHRAFKKFLHQDIQFFDDPMHSTGALSVRLSRDVALMQQAGGRTLGQAINAVTVLTAALVISFLSNVYLTLVILGLVPFIVIAGYLQMKTLAGHENSNKDRLQEAGQIAVETIENMRTVAAFGLEDRRYKAYMNSLSTVHVKEKRESHVYGLMSAFGVGAIFTIYAVAFRFGGYLIANHGVPYLDVFQAFSALVFSAMSLGQGSSFAGEAGKGGPATARIYHLLDSAPGVYDSTAELESPADVRGTIELDNVDFTYPARPDLPVLKKFSFQAKEGQTVALVGASGCGKSTSVSLLERFYDAESGRVNVSGHDVNRVNVRWLRKQMGIVEQEPILFDASIADNIAYGALYKDLITQEEIEEAARKANIHSFIVGLPQGYETNVGQKGTQLSGGQKQRVAIARALIRNPKILLLDEATSALDTESEQVVQAALDEARVGRTCVVIAHRLSTIQSADCIYVLGNGEVLEYGTHDELLARENGAYYNLNKAQITNRKIN